MACDTFEAFRMPASRFVLKEADSRTDCCFTTMTLCDRLHALTTVQVPIHKKVTLFLKVFSATFADEASLMPVLAFVGQLLGTNGNWLPALLTLVGIFEKALLT